MLFILKQLYYGTSQSGLTKEYKIVTDCKKSIFLLSKKWL
ncbi:hypothetical protein HMPREF9388_1588 [Streptococcus sanguinis SK353]|uniref:Uncharacterized protein n=1 Tax=Streptococcus sanguinis SK353 TaxID=888815 RepID=F0FFV6_STRSA|nr:hypothetical protein HMPREF9388_1588 [Streptococcus sanguinis SK353]